MAKHVGVQSKAEDIGSDYGWNDDDRRAMRYNRIRARVPTGHPQLAKQVLALSETASSSDSGEQALAEASESSESERGEIAGDVDASEEEVDLHKHHHHHHHHRHHHHHHHHRHRDERGVKYKGERVEASAAPKERKSCKKSTEPRRAQFDENKTVATLDDSDTSWEERHQERYSRIRARVPTGHPGLAKKVAELRETVEV